MRNVNTRYTIISHIKKYMQDDFKKRKATFERNNNKKYFKVDYFKEVADYCGITQSTASQIFQKNLNPSYIVAVTLSRFLGVDQCELWEVVESVFYDGITLKELNHMWEAVGCEHFETFEAFKDDYINHRKEELQRKSDNIERHNWLYNKD